MDEDNSNDVVVIENNEDVEIYPSSSSGARPLMMLFHRLISNDSKSNTVLTNVQILSILDKEFNIDISTLHELEVDIYINIVKKFLKDWPQWDAFDRVINKLKKKPVQTEITTILESKYKDLKEYLQSMIDIANQLAKEAVENLKNGPEKQKEKGASDIVLEIYCTRRMLNKFIYNGPHPKENDSLFNLVEFEPYKLDSDVPHYTFTSILHWYGVQLSIDLPNFQFTRYTAHQLSHVLVNDSNGPRKKHKELDTSVYMKTNRNTTNSILIASLVTYLDRVLDNYRSCIEYDMVKEIFSVIKTDLILNSKTIEVPGLYKQHSSKYPYVRRLYTDVPVERLKPSPHNIYIEETLIPIQDWHISKFIYIVPPNSLHLQSWLTLECNECKQKFNGAEFLTMLRDHYKVYHNDEPDWTCTNCKESFNMAQLTSQGWRHAC